MPRTAEQTVADARKWVKANQRMWRAFEERARRASKEGRCWSARGIAEGIRWDGSYRKAYGEDFKIPNHITPVLGRFVVELHPDTAIYFRKSRSKVDGFTA